MSVEFHPLRVASVDELTEDSVAITFDVPTDLSDRFRYLPGQHVTLKADIEGSDVRRSYSVCANANGGLLRVGVKKLDGGVFSGWATSGLRAGTVIEVAPPTGEFTISPDADAAHHYAAIVAGSGITPVLSLVSTTLESEPASRWTVIFGNRSANSVMFLDEVEGLKDTYPDRLHLIHVLSREETEVNLFTGRIDADRLSRMFASVIDAESVDRWFLCGPYEMVTESRRLLESRGVSPDDIRDELFFAGPIDPSLLTPPDEIEGAVALRITLGGRTTETRMDPEMSILDAGSRVRPDLPFSCKGGMCATCKARVVTGEVQMDKNYALIDAEIASGYVLTCQSHPLGDEVAVDYDV